jgi:hypothetical protein
MKICTQMTIKAFWESIQKGLFKKKFNQNSNNLWVMEKLLWHTFLNSWRLIKTRSNELPRTKLTITPFITIYHYHAEAYKILIDFPPMLMLFLNIHLAHSSTLIYSNNLSFVDWLKSPSQQQELNQLAEWWQWDKLPNLNIKPCVNLLRNHEWGAQQSAPLYLGPKHNQPFTLKTTIPTSRTTLLMWGILTRFHRTLCTFHIQQHEALRNSKFCLC